MTKTPFSPAQDSYLFDRKVVRKHRERAVGIDWSRHGFLFAEVADRMADRLLDITRTYDLALDLGCRGGAFADALRARSLASTVIQADLAFGHVAETGGDRSVVADEEFLPFAPASFDLVGSVLNLHWTNDLPGALVQIARSLKPDGLFLGSLFGIESLQELKWCLTQAESEVSGGVHPRISPFTEVRDAGGLLQRAGLALPVTDVDTVTLKYSDPFALMRELRGMGEGNALVQRQKTLTGRRVLFRAAELYMENFADEDGLIPATFQIIYMTGWSPHASQQEPARRGSGQASLTDILSKD
ncbi:methyltransferase domain-containing protein [Sneathiella chinensis]|uniref:SAM-dependent methyltransferase n=1 Tax=Sneathiella chinensis TaxID=349750 RepID=A0ABQ5UA42_9PROT|nr:methyltransferase domain-containing protein [Sneathiella chinensis]GLQ08050.1 SAM-dependent methyltransferase [Sneathiella chinensis]